MTRPDITGSLQERWDDAHARVTQRFVDRRALKGDPNPEQPKEHKPSIITRAASHWADRLMGAVRDRDFGGQEAVYESNRTSRDYIGNTAGMVAFGIVFPILTIVATRISGVELSGMFSMAFVVSTLLVILANFGVRTFQISDINEVHSFADYQVNRIITCVVMLIVGFVYVKLRGYGPEMAGMCAGLFVYKMVDGLADVYEGRLQQKDKLYLAGASQAVRSLLVTIAFSLVLLIGKNIVAATTAMAVVSIITLVLFTMPMAFFETPKSARPELSSVIELFRQCWPLFVALFLYALIDAMPKLVMENLLSYDNQLYINALIFPAHMILVTAQLIYKPLLVRMAQVWADPSIRRRFDIAMLAVFAVIVVITLVMVLFMGWIGLKIMTWLYGIDFLQFRGLCFTMLAAGGIIASIDFLYQTITVLRRQRDVTVVYGITFIFALFVPWLLIGFTGLAGAILSYLIVMAILFVLLIWVYIRIRWDMARNPEKVPSAATSPDRADEVDDEPGAAIVTTQTGEIRRTRFINPDDDWTQPTQEQKAAEREARAKRRRARGSDTDEPRPRTRFL